MDDENSDYDTETQQEILSPSDARRSIGDRAVLQEQFIDEIFKREPIWNRYSRQHKDLQLVNALYDEVSILFNMSRDESKRLWKNLVDQFRRHLKVDRNRPTGSTSSNHPPVRWLHYHQMMFMAPCISNRSSFGNLLRQKKTDTPSSSPSISTYIFQESQDIEIVTEGRDEEDANMDLAVSQTLDASLPQPEELSNTSSASTPRPQSGKNSTCRRDMVQEVASLLSSSLKDVSACLSDVQCKVQSNAGGDPKANSRLSLFMRFSEKKMENLPPHMVDNCEQAISDVIRLCCQGRAVTVIETSMV